MAQAFYFARRYDEAIEQSHRVIKEEPNYFLVHFQLGRAFAEKGNFAGAIRELQTAMTLTRGHPVIQMALGNAYARAGQRQKAIAALAELRAASRTRYVPHLYEAGIYLGLDQKNDALRALDQACAERSDYLIYLKVEPYPDRVRNTPEFDRIVKCVGLP